MIAELRETLELLRTLDGVITYSENHCATIPVKQAAKRARERLIDCAREAIEDLGRSYPKADPKEIKRWTDSLDNGAILPAEQHLGASERPSKPKQLSVAMAA